MQDLLNKVKSHVHAERGSRIFVAMSGGVDSSVSAAVLSDLGYQVMGATMSLWENSNSKTNTKRCCGVNEAFFAKAVCDKIGVEHYTFDMKDDFKKHVVDNFIEEYQAGRTPNPCVRCNQFMKFDIMLEMSQKLACDFIATGHYAQVVRENEQFKLKTGDDPFKDQSYFLYPILQKDLKKILFPLAGLEKKEVRQLAEYYELPTASKPESQDICFIPKSHVNFMEKQGVKPQSGPVLHSDGQKLGEHQGLHQFTIGQRRGLGIAYHEPLYVKHLDMTHNALIVGSESELYQSRFSIPELNILSPDDFSSDSIYEVKVRYRTRGKACKLRKEIDGSYTVILDESERGITSGQSAVLYKNRIVVAGGIIRAEALHQQKEEVSA